MENFKYKKVLFIGLGGAGQRHLRIFQDLLPIETKFLAFRSKSSTPLLKKDFTVNTKSKLKKKYNYKSLIRLNLLSNRNQILRLFLLHLLYMLII